MNHNVWPEHTTHTRLDIGMAPKRTYFDHLPRDALQTIARFLSSEPQHDAWRRRLPAAAVALVFNERSALRGAAEDVADRKLCVYEDQDDIELVARMVALAGQRFSRLELEGLYFRKWMRVAALVERHCMGVRELALTGWNAQLVRIFEVFGARIEVVKLRLFPITKPEIREVMGAVAAHCTALREVAFRVQHLRETDVVWRRCGATLRSVSITPFPSTYITSVLQQVGLHCSQLDNVHISTFFGKLALMAAVARLLVSLGTRLRFAFLGDMSASLCREVAEKCVNARFTVKDSPCTALQMAALGEQLREVQVTTPRKQEIEDVALSEVKLSRLERVKFNCKAVGAEFLSAVFARELPALRSVDMFYFSYVTGRIIDVMARQAKELRRLELSEVNFEMAMFSLFASSCTQLEHVCVEGFNQSGEDDALMVIDVVQSFTVCEKLSTLEIGPIGRCHTHEDAVAYLYDSGIATACLPLRRRRVHLKIGGTVL